ncbi:phosphate acetyltransferase [Spiroplasma sp. ChiS]|uniref:phosphate acetyltransferase n=1 Tax=Spiroplasma sp. ChiS TaxID=2099885 RepID=UPI000CF94855|nr:phosphate acetyltransferase [Spiroplasma sp. ChiS]PQP78369.1 phosphate acetyltransferase [Spiroplasma sp. ChiS]
MNILENILEKINTFSQKIKIIFPEGNSERIQTVAKQLIGTNITPILVFATRAEVLSTIDELQSEVLVAEEQNEIELAEYLVELCKGKVSLSEAKQLVRECNYLAILWVKKGLADGMVGGITYDTKDIIGPALRIIKTKPNVKLVSSFFLMVRNTERYIFTDCALNIDPTAEELADIAYLGYEASQVFAFQNPNMALLSFSTKGSGRGTSVDKVRTAYDLVRAKNLKNCYVEGEFQFDAAWDDTIRNKKAPSSSLKAPVDIFVFPNLDAGNIGYKIAQRLGGFEAIGPIVIGLDRPVNDLSRGATINDIYNTVLVTAYLCIHKSND